MGVLDRDIDGTPLLSSYALTLGRYGVAYSRRSAQIRGNSDKDSEHVVHKNEELWLGSQGLKGNIEGI